MSNDPNDLTVLTPGHFLIGETLTTTVDVKATEPRTSLGTHWKALSQVKHNFKKRWYNEYLNELQYKHKWKEQCKDVKPGTIVVINEDNTPLLHWPLRRIVNFYIGEDNVCRSSSRRKNHFGSGSHNNCNKFAKN